MDDYYPYEEGGWQKKFEMTIPIILLILVLVVLAWKLQWFCSVPGISDIACGGSVINILVIGNDASVIQQLDSMKVGMSINYAVYSKEDIKNLRDSSYLKNYDLIILTESIGYDKVSDLPYLFRTYMSEYMANNGKLIMFGIAGATDPDTPAANGWRQAGLDSYIPVVCRNGICSTDSKDSAAADISTFRLKNTEHTMLREFGTSIPVTGAAIEYTLVNNEKGTEILTLEVERVGIQASPAIVEMSHGVAGKTIYFAYNPARTPLIFQNAIKYITGR